MPPTTDTQRALFRAIMAAEQCAHLQAKRQAPLWDRTSALILEHLTQHFTTTDLLEDRYTLRVLRAFEVGWPEYNKIMLKRLMQGWEAGAASFPCTPTGVRLPVTQRREGAGSARHDEHS